MTSQLKEYKVGDCIGEMHCQSWAGLKQHLEKGTKTLFGQEILDKLEEIGDYFGFYVENTDDAPKIMYAIAGKEFFVTNKYVYLLKNDGYGWVAGYCYDGRHVGFAKIVLKGE